jgi:aminomethyltransferase
MPTDGLLRTPLYDRHVEAGARFVPFAGYAMPVQYEGVIPEHLAVRSSAGIFDVSHMGRLDLTGLGVLPFLQGVLSNDLGRIGPGQAQYTLLLDERGCPIDDLIAYRFDDEHVLLVVNASRLDVDRAWLESRAPRSGVTIDDRTRYTAMIALQGPLALSLVGLPVADAFAFAPGVVSGVDALVARTGYTGEPGVELIVAAGDAVELWDGLLVAGAAPIGLGARDTLRLEMCYPLYGNDLTDRHTALEGGLGWACALDSKEFVGADALRAQRAAGGFPRLVPFTMSGRGIPRPGMAVVGGGEVTSGTMSPSLEQGIGMAYLPAAAATVGTELVIDVRGRDVTATVAKKPLYHKEILG